MSLRKVGEQLFALADVIWTRDVSRDARSRQNIVA
jgi:hypothetical protein